VLLPKIKKIPKNTNGRLAIPALAGLLVSIVPPTVGKRAISVAFVCLSVRPSIHLSVAYIANNSRTQRPSMHIFGRKVPHLRCDSRTSLKVKRSKVRVGKGRGHTVSAELSGHMLVTQVSVTQRKFPRRSVPPSQIICNQKPDRRTDRRTDRQTDTA